MIKSIHIKNFKAIKNIKLDDLSHINYLVGPNGSGKSSILQCIQYIRAGYLGFGQKGDLIIDCLNSKNALQIASLFETNFCLEITQGIVKNRLDKYEEDIVKLIVKGKPQVESGKLIFKSPDTIDTTGSHKDFGGFFFENYTTIYLDTHNTSFDSDIIYKSPKLQYENTLSQEYISLTGNARTKVELQNALPDIKNLMEEIFNQQFKEHFLIEELSAGLRLLALIKSYIQKHIEKPSLMLFIEEPETSLHPGVQKNFPLMLEKLIEEELGKDKSKLQIFVTTHSPFTLISSIKHREKLSIPYRSVKNEGKSKILNQKIYLLENGENSKSQKETTGNTTPQIISQVTEILGASFTEIINVKHKPNLNGLKKIKLCFVEGKDAVIYQNIFENRSASPDFGVIFIPTGGFNETLLGYYSLKHTLKQLLGEERTEIFAIVDRSNSKGTYVGNDTIIKTGEKGDAFTDESMELFNKWDKGENIHMLNRREIENYIYDSEVVEEAYPALVNSYLEWLSHNKIDISISEVKDKINSFVNHTQIKKENLLNTNSFRQLIFSELGQFLKELEGESYIDSVI